MENVTNFIKISSNPKLKMSPDGDFFRCWVEFLRPIHKLANREMGVLAVFLKTRFNLSKAIIDDDTLDRVLMSAETKHSIREECNLSAKHFQVVMCKFRKNGVVKNDRIDRRLIPTTTEDGVGLMVYFNFKDEQLIKLGPHKGI